MALDSTIYHRTHQRMSSKSLAPDVAIAAHIRSIFKHFAIHIDVIVATVPLPRAECLMVGGREDSRGIFDGTRREVDIAFDELIRVGLSDSDAVDGGFGVHVGQF